MTVTLKINSDIAETHSPNIVRHSIPERTGDVLQDMGRGSKVIPLTGWTRIQSEKNQLQTWADNRSELTYTDDENSGGIKVRITEFEARKKVSYPSNYYEYSFNIIEDE